MCNKDTFSTVLFVAMCFGLHHTHKTPKIVIFITKFWFTCLIFYLIFLDCIIIKQVINGHHASTYHVSYTFETFEIFNIEFVFVVYQFMWTAAFLTSYYKWQQSRTETKKLIDQSQIQIIKVEVHKKFNLQEKSVKWAIYYIIITALGANIYHLLLTASTIGGSLFQFPLGAYRTFLKCLGPSVTECLFLVMIYTANQTITNMKQQLQKESLTSTELAEIRSQHYEVIQHLYGIQARFQLELVLILLACLFDVLMNIYSIAFNAYRVFHGPGLQDIDWFVFFNIYQAAQKGAQILLICLPVDNLNQELYYFDKQCAQEHSWMYLFGMFQLDNVFVFMVVTSLGSYITVLLQFAKGE